MAADRARFLQRGGPVRIHRARMVVRRAPHRAARRLRHDIAGDQLRAIPRPAMRLAQGGAVTGKGKLAARAALRALIHDAANAVGEMLGHDAVGHDLRHRDLARARLGSGLVVDGFGKAARLRQRRLGRAAQRVRACVDVGQVEADTLQRAVHGRVGAVKLGQARNGCSGTNGFVQASVVHRGLLQLHARTLVGRLAGHGWHGHNARRHSGEAHGPSGENLSLRSHCDASCDPSPGYASHGP